MDEKVIQLVGDENSPSSIDIAVNGTFSSVKNIGILAKAYASTLHVSISGVLAVGLWAALLLTIYWQTAEIKHLMRQYVSLNLIASFDSEEIETRRWQSFERASLLVNDTAKTLYAVLAPLATAATGFYFTSTHDVKDE